MCVRCACACARVIEKEAQTHTDNATGRQRDTESDCVCMRARACMCVCAQVPWSVLGFADAPSLCMAVNTATSTTATWNSMSSRWREQGVSIRRHRTKLYPFCTVIHFMIYLHIFHRCVRACVRVRVRVRVCACACAHSHAWCIDVFTHTLFHVLTHCTLPWTH